MTPEARKAHADFLERQGSHAALTLTYNEDNVSRERIKRDLQGLHAHIDRHLLGRRFNKRPALERSQVWAVIEKIETRPHFHCGWKLPSPHEIAVLERLFLGGLWLTFAPIGEYHIKPYKSGWAGYATKALTDSMDIIESGEFFT
jgi:hypothetical protein